MKYKNISERAKRYARGKGYAHWHDEIAMDGFAAGYRFAIKEMRELLPTMAYGSTLDKFLNDTERLK